MRGVACAAPSRRIGWAFVACLAALGTDGAGWWAGRANSCGAGKGDGGGCCAGSMDSDCCGVLPIVLAVFVSSVLPDVPLTWDFFRLVLDRFDPHDARDRNSTRSSEDLFGHNAKLRATYTDLMSLSNRLLSNRFPRSSKYHPDWAIASTSGGANALWLTEWLAESLDLRPGMRVLDLGCGRAMSSIFLRREFGVQVWACDLWFDVSENMQRIRDAGFEEGSFPFTPMPGPF